MEAKAHFNIPHVMARIQVAGVEMADALALQIEAKTKVKITNNGQVDTGFMRNSTYTVSKRSSRYAKTDPSGSYQSGKGKTVKRKIAPEVRLPGDALAACAVGAEYAVFQEVKRSFLYAATVDVARGAGGTAEKVFKDNLHD